MSLFYMCVFCDSSISLLLSDFLSCTVYDRILTGTCIPLSVLFGSTSIRTCRLYELRHLLDANADACVVKV